jgi:hypothetical protein
MNRRMIKDGFVRFVPGTRDTDPFPVFYAEIAFENIFAAYFAGSLVK